MSHTAVIITVAYSIAVVIGSAFALVIFHSTMRPEDDDRSGVWSRRETGWLIVMTTLRSSFRARTARTTSSFPSGVWSA